MTVKITTATNRSSIEGNGYDLTEVSQLLSYRPDGYKFMGAYRYGGWDGYIRLLTAKGTFPTGLMPMLVDFLTKEKVPFAVVDLRVKPKLPVKVGKTLKLKGAELYPHQIDVVRAALNHGRGVLKVATGGGKGEIMCGIIKSLTGKNPPKTLVIVPNRNLLKQTADRLSSRLGYPVGLIGSGAWKEDWVTVAIPNTLGQPKHKEARKALMESCELLLIDECHHAKATTWSACIRGCKAYYRFGLSGTPLNTADGGGLTLVGLTGPMLVDITTDQLVKMGKLAKPRVEMVKIQRPPLADNLRYPDVYKLGVVHNKHLAEAIVSKVLEHSKEKKTILILVTHIEQGRIMSLLLKQANVEHEFVHGQTPTEFLNGTLDDFRAGQLRVLIASAVFGEGTDIPNIDVLIVSDGGKSVIKTVQKAGRGLRVKKTGKNEVLIIDFMNLTHPKLQAHSEARLKTYTHEGFELVK